MKVKWSSTHHGERPPGTSLAHTLILDLSLQSLEMINHLVHDRLLWQP